MVILVIASFLALADDQPGRLPGSDLGVVEAGQRALYVVEARIVRLGERRANPFREDGLLYPRVAIEPSRAIKGAPTAWVKGSLRQVGLVLSEGEAVPREGEVYVLYIERMNRGHYVFKATRPDGAVPVVVPGREIGLSEAEKAATYVIEARIGDLGPTERDAHHPRGLVYPRISIDPSAVIKGEDRAAAMAIRGVRLAVAREETAPESGKTYVLYLRGSGHGLEVFRFTDRSPAASARLPGAALGAAEADKLALYVVEARILHLGEWRQDPGRRGGLVYPRIAIEPSRLIRERHEGAARSNRDVRLVLAEDETIPREGETYTLYIRGKDRGFEVFKVMPRPAETPR